MISMEIPYDEDLFSSNNKYELPEVLPGRFDPSLSPHLNAETLERHFYALRILLRISIVGS
jgi:hypothetical protein